MKDDVKKAVAEGKRAQQSVTKDDYEETGKADTVSFWFIGGTSVQYVVGQEIVQEDFDRINRQLKSLELREKSDGKPSDDKADQPTK